MHYLIIQKEWFTLARIQGENHGQLKDKRTIFINLTDFIHGFTVGVIDPDDSQKTVANEFKDQAHALGEIIAILKESDITQVMIYGFIEQRDHIAGLIDSAIELHVDRKDKNDIQIFFNPLPSRSGA